MSWLLSAFADEAGDTTEQQIQALKRAGLHAIDPRNVERCNISQLPLDVATKAAAQLAAAKIKVHMFGSPLGKIDIADDFKIDVDKLDHLAKLKDVFSCNAVRIFSYYNKAQKPLDQWQKASLDRLSRLRDQAGRLGLVLYHENERHIFGDRGPQVEEIAAKLRDGKTFKMIFDFDNYNQSGDDVWANWLRQRDTVDAFHLKDSDRQNHHVPVGEGAGRVADILKDALARQWQGTLSLEPHLTHSSAVMATGPSGQANQKLADLPPAESFHVAATAALKVLKQVGAKIS
ncbi:MAG: sugar phosphate isomerase/epimerase [Phycisphaeraceae bacterium]|nr:sugar phosphate isomerase/epimerase [Phycisphaeraceae bacterium]